jgi:threonine/homoserine efflux transporter RhtA
MDASGGVAGAGLVLILLLRPWRLRDQASREWSALVCAILLAMLLVRLCLPA